MTTIALREEAARLTRQFQGARRERDLVILEGFHPLKHGLRFGAEIDEIATSDRGKLIQLAREFAPELAGEIESRAVEVSRKVFKQLGPYEPHTGVVSIAHRRAPDPLLLLRSERDAPVILLEDPRHRGNLGAVVRVAAAADAAGVLTTGIHDPWDPVAVRGSAGLHFAVPVARLSELPATERPLFALDPEGERFRASDIPARAILAFGSERQGLSEDLLSRADHCVSLPMREGVSSLNLATSVAAVLYSIRLSTEN
ncbi:MAG TPA: TrmH family RNA methyltransferase [Solirubrobacteraceae bacterium]|jgi:TrmH family RNA methyltransferase